MGRGRRKSGAGSGIIVIVVLIVAGILVFLCARGWLVKKGVLKSTIYYQLSNYESIYSEDEPLYYGYVEEGEVLSPDSLGRENLLGSNGKLIL